MAEKRGWCSGHYYRWKRHGDPLLATRDMRPASVRWKDSYTVHPESGCWIWHKSIDRNGYGYISDGANVRVWAHRYVWMQLRGPIPKTGNSYIDHLCRNPPCVNPDHLELVTQAENVRRGEAGLDKKMQTHCKRGHEFTSANTMHIEMDDGRIHRRCRACHQLRSQQWIDANLEKRRASNREYQRRRRIAAKDGAQPEE